MQPTLLILAAGMASRYGSMKQIQSFGPGGETIMDYSIYDAIRAGFKKVVFIIRESFAEEFKEIFEPKLKGKIETGYVYQDLNSFLEGRSVPEGRTKPWGTAHAVLCAKDAVKEAIAVAEEVNTEAKKRSGWLTLLLIILAIVILVSVLRRGMSAGTSESK